MGLGWIKTMINFVSNSIHYFTEEKLLQ
jgi:hypothetical protein